MTEAASKHNPDNPRPVRRMIVMTIMLVVAWLLWSGFFKTLLLSLGALSVFLTMWIVKRMGYFDEETYAFRYNHRLLGYWVWLGKEVILSSIDVAKEVLRPEIRVRPATVKLDVSDLDKVDQATYGNCITLTPGTLTLDAFDDQLTVHALTKNGKEGLLGGEMHRRVKALRS